MTRIALGLSYLGTAYHGWQSQPSGRTVQDRLEHALGKFSTQSLRTRCAGRTDTGVHALLQVVHFDTDLEREEFSWVRGTNRFLPSDIAIQWARRVPEDFHASASARGRRYSYIVLQSPVRPSLEAGRVGWSFHPLELQAMKAAAEHLAGEHDFSSFRTSECQALTPIRRLAPIDISRRGAYWRFDFESNGFLHHMIRNIMGCLLRIGQGLQEPGWMAEVLQARDRRVAAPMFTADGLYFQGPLYEPHWGLPEHTAAYDWLP